MFIDPRHLVQLAVIVEQRSFSKAAEKLGLTQPALSRNIRLLERRVGAPLLDRTRGNIRPTALGRQLTARGAIINSENRQAERIAANTGRGLAGELRIGAPPLACEHMLVAPLLEVSSSFPGLTLRVRSGTMDELTELLIDAELDMVFGALRSFESEKGLASELLVQHRIGIFARPGHPLAGRRAASAAQLASYPWIGMRLNSFIRAQMDMALAHMGLDRISLACESWSEPMIIRMVAASDHLTMLPLGGLGDFISSGQLVEIHTRHVLPSHPVGLVYRRDALETQARAAARAVIARHMRAT